MVGGYVRFVSSLVILNLFTKLGHDTTTSGLCFALYSISKHPIIQEKIVKELHSIFSDDTSRCFTYQDLQNMKYLELVIKETLRMYPPVPIFSRTSNTDAMIDRQTLPKDVTLTIFSLGLHTNPKIFPNPEVFDPNRFLPENTIGRSPFAYVPFSAGPRNCIGQRFAMLEMKTTIAKILLNFELFPVEGHEPMLIPDVILKSRNGLPIILKKRKLYLYCNSLE